MESKYINKTFKDSFVDDVEATENNNVDINQSDDILKEIELVEVPFYKDITDSDGNLLNELDIVRISDLSLTIEQKYALDLLELDYTGFDAVYISEAFVMIDSINENTNELVLDRYVIIPARFFMVNPECGNIQKLAQTQVVISK